MINYSVKEFFTTPGIAYDEYFAVLKAINPVNDYQGKQAPDLGTMTWNDVINLEHAYDKMLAGNYEAIFDIFRICYGANEEEFYGSSIFDVYKAFNWIMEAFKDIKEKEQANLGYEPTGEEMEAGIDKLSKFGKGALIDSLAHGDILKWDAVVQKSYNEVFFKLCLDKTRYDIEKELMKIRTSRP